MFGSRKAVGAAIKPAIAPSTAAKPQPSASIQPPRTPMSLLASELTATERIANPSVVKRKNAHSTKTETRQTQNVPTSWIEIATPATATDRVGHRLSTAF